MRKIYICMIAVISIMIASCGNSKGYKNPDQVEAEKTVASGKLATIENLSDSQVSESEANSDSQGDEEAAVYYNMVKNGKPGIIDFNATWCGPCRQMKPVFHQLARKYGDKYNFISIDIDQYPELAEKYHIQSIPTFVFIDADGIEGNRILGAVDASVLAEELENPAWY